jgi:hypothetical protein
MIRVSLAGASCRGEVTASTTFGVTARRRRVGPSPAGPTKTFPLRYAVSTLAGKPVEQAPISADLKDI